MLFDFFLIAIIILELTCNFTFNFYVFLIYIRHALKTMYAFKKSNEYKRSEMKIPYKACVV